MTARAKKAVRPVRPPFVNVYWFPLAALYGALALPISVFGQFGWLPVPPGLQHGVGHAHEMLFGFALAVVAGYILGPRSGWQLRVPIIVWLLARVSYLWWPDSFVAAVFNVLFIMLLVYLVAPTYLRTAKKWRNKSIAFILLGLMLAVMLFHGFTLMGQPGLSFLVLFEAVLLLSALMFFMGGRMIAPAMAGHLKRHRIKLRNRVQPNIEAAVLLLLPTVLVLNALPSAIGRQLAGLLLLGCALLATIRMARWRIWYCWNRADLLALLSGYSWLIVGWFLVGLALFVGWALTPMLHAITVGALGTLTLSVMLRARMHRCLKSPDARPWFYLAALPVSVAAVWRITWPNGSGLLWAAGFWSLAFVSLLVMLLYLGWCHKKGVAAGQRRMVKPAPGAKR